jgi:DNA primase
MISFNQLKQSVSIESVLADKNLVHLLKKRGTRLIGPCPIHQGDNPHAFIVDLSQNLWHCFGVGVVTS